MAVPVVTKITPEIAMRIAIWCLNNAISAFE